LCPPCRGGQQQADNAETHRLHITPGSTEADGQEGEKSDGKGKKAHGDL
jgi:hypothetical protein